MLFYVYRINEMANWERCFIPANNHLIDKSPDFPMKAFFKLIAQIGWDNSWTEIVYQFALPMPSLVVECCAIQEVKLGRWFIGSPVPLSYLDDRIDYDARTDSQEVKRAIAEIEGGELKQRRPAALTRAWRISTKGHPSASIEGLNVCVMKSTHSDGYYGIIFSATNKKVKTPIFATEDQAKSCLFNNFYTLTDVWNAQPEDIYGDDEDYLTGIILSR